MKTHAIVTASILACAAVAAFGVSLRAATPPHPVSRDTFLRNLRAHVKHVFVIYQENHTFDNYFGTYPGADNLTTSQAQAHGYRQPRIGSCRRSFQPKTRRRRDLSRERRASSLRML